jgi:hypothetical protein
MVAHDSSGPAELGGDFSLGLKIIGFCDFLIKKYKVSIYNL